MSTTKTKKTTMSVKVAPRPKQQYTREDVSAEIARLRQDVGIIHSNGAFSSTAALLVPLTHLDNATYFMCCGEFDRSMNICKICESALPLNKDKKNAPEGYAYCTKHGEWYDTKHWSCCEKCWENLKLKRMTKDA